jgi:hypothetical protein
MILDIRGGLGTQVLELIYGLALAKLKGDIIDEVHVNVAGDVVEPAKCNYVNRIFVLPMPVRTVEGVGKQNVWTEEKFELLAETDANSLLDFVFPDKLKKSKVGLVLHARGKDRDTASVEDYLHLIYNCDFLDIMTIELVSDDYSLAEKIINATPELAIIANITLTSNPTFRNYLDIVDWQKLLTANALTGPFSSFTTSAMMFNPLNKFVTLSEGSSHGPIKLATKHYNCMKILSKKFPNMRII